MRAMSDRFRDRRITFANGAVGEVVEVPSASPRNYYDAISRPDGLPPVTIDGQLFLPPGARARVPVVIVVPGSLSVAPSHVRHAETLTGMGCASFVLDPFAARGVTSTVANQTQFSFAASAWDVLAAVRVLAARPEIDPARIALQGHSRGGTAVLNAVMRPLRERALGAALRVRAVLAAYPWAGHQFLDPDTGGAEVRVLIGDRDDWVSPQQAQGYVQAMRLRGASASIRIVPGAAHSFDRGEPMRKIPEASVSPAAPTTYVADDGAFLHPTSDTPDPALVDRDVAVYALKSGYGVRGASLGSDGDQAALFRDDMVAFFRRTLL
jgi:dienelactone hydrolase